MAMIRNFGTLIFEKLTNAYGEWQNYQPPKVSYTYP